MEYSDFTPDTGEAFAQAKNANAGWEVGKLAGLDKGSKGGVRVRGSGGSGHSCAKRGVCGGSKA